MRKDIFKRILSVIMAVILCTGMLGGFSAFAAGEQVENYQLAFPRRGDVNYSDKWGHGKLKHMNGWFSDEAKYNTVFTIGSYSGPACYCIEPGTPIENKYKLTSRDESYWDNFPSEYNHTITVPDIKIFIGRIMQYGYTGNVSMNWRTQNEADADSFSLYYATQLLIWETVVGERDSDFNHITPVGCNAILDKIGAEHPMKSRIMSHYNNIVAGVKTHTTTPSFCSKTPSGGETKELKWDGTQYTATFTDTNNILQRFSFSADNGHTCRVAGNTLTVSGTAAPKGTVTVTAVKNTAGRKGIIVWGDGKAMYYLHLAAEHGNQYAAQLIHSIRVNGNWTAAIASLRLFGHMAHVIQNRLEDERRGRENSIDRKLRRKIEEKKQAHGLKQ